MSTVTADELDQLTDLIKHMRPDGDLEDFSDLDHLRDSPHPLVVTLIEFMEAHEQQTYQLRKTARDLKYLKSFGNRLAYACDLAIEDIGRRL